MLPNYRGIHSGFLIEDSENIPHFVNVLKEGLKEKKPLSPGEQNKIASFVDKHFSKAQGSSKKPEYISAKASKMPRSLVLDYSKKQFFILSKKHSLFSFVGSERKFTTSTLFCHNETKAEYKPLASLTNIESESVESIKRQAALADDIYQDILLVVEYTSRKNKKKIIVFEELYDTTVGKVLKEGSLSPWQISSIFRQVITTITFLHKNGYVHGDITHDNMLVKDLQSEQIKAKLTDFGMTYNPDDDEMPRKMVNSYGTSSYSAPELFGASQPLDDPFEQGKAEDMFALGCSLYLMLFPEHKRLPWYYEVDRAIHKPSKDTKEAATKKYKEALEVLEQRAISEPDVERQRLKGSTIHLLACDPRLRCKIEEINN